MSYTGARGPLYPARGYLLYVTNPAGAMLRLTGTVPTDATAVPLYASWNLVGHTRLGEFRGQDTPITLDRLHGTT